MEQDRFTALADELNAEGDHLAAATIMFVGQLHLLKAKSDLLFLSSIAQYLSSQAVARFERDSLEEIAIEELVSQL